jgi:hypothetical protein
VRGVSDAPPTPADAAADSSKPTSAAASASPARFHRFRDRLAGRAAETILRRDIPEHLAGFLRQWISAVCRLDDRVAQRVALRLGLDRVLITSRGMQSWSYVAALNRVTGEPDLLDVVDAILAVHGAPDELRSMGVWSTTGEEYVKQLRELHDALEDVGSAFTVDENCRQLIERVEPTVDDLVQDTIEAAQRPPATCCARPASTPTVCIPTRPPPTGKRSGRWRRSCVRWCC